MRRRTAVLAAVVAICLLRVTDVLAAGGFGQPPPDETVGPTLHVKVVMEGPRQPAEPTYRQFSVQVFKGGHSESVIFVGGVSYTYGCLVAGFPSLRASTEQRFIGFMNSWAPFEVLDALILPLGDPDRAAIVAIDNISCTPVGDREYLAFRGVIRFAK
jgi:hypothetical protein